MRLWSIHPQYLDTRGLLAVWREGLLAKCVLEGKTKGYKHHPQLDRFKCQKKPIEAISEYLSAIFAESKRRNYHFDGSKIGDQTVIAESKRKNLIAIPVTEGQVIYEYEHLLQKLEQRDKEAAEKLRKRRFPMLHPIFFSIPGDVETWERLQK
ncbi:MAG: pyrimidine dimer DNA glycosylase/endonuclease V [Thermoguttaceae bacterium]